MERRWNFRQREREPFRDITFYETQRFLSPPVSPVREAVREAVREEVTRRMHPATRGSSNIVVIVESPLILSAVNDVNVNDTLEVSTLSATTTTQTIEIVHDITPVQHNESPQRSPQQRILPRWSFPTPPATERTTRSKSVTPKKVNRPNSDTPVAGPSGGIRTSPRKRLQLSTPEKNSTNVNLFDSPKKVKFDLVPKKPSTYNAALKSLSNEQLVNLIEKLAEQEPELGDKISSMIPPPDLGPIEKELKYLRTCIFKSIPASTSRLVSKTDAVSFSKAYVPLMNFKKYLIEMGTKLSDSEHYDIVIKYIFIGWNLIRTTPNWDVVFHNDIKRKCFRFLSNTLQNAIENGKFEDQELLEIREQAFLLTADYKEVELTVNYIDAIIKSKTNENDRDDDNDVEGETELEH